MLGQPVLVAIRDVAPDEKNPFTANQVVDMFVKDQECGKWIEEGMMKLMIIPDIEGIYYGRDVGYKVEQISVPAEIAEISATKIREQMKSSGRL